MASEGAFSSSRGLLNRLSRRYLRLSSLLGLAVIVYALAGAALFGAGLLDTVVGGYLLLPMLVLGVMRPAWLVIAIVAIPSAYTGSAITGLTIVLIFALIVHVGRQGSLSLGFTSGLLPVVVLLVLGFLFRADVGHTAAAARDSFLTYLGYYIALAILTFSLVRTGDLTVRQLLPALLVGAGGTALAVAATQGLSGLVQRASDDSAVGLSLQSSFAYLSAMAFVISLAWVLSDGEYTKVERPIRWMITAFFAVMTAFSFTRGAWLVAVLGLIYVPRRTGKLRYVWFAPLLVSLLLLLVPLASDRLSSDIGQGVGQSFATGEIGTGRWGLWESIFEEAQRDIVFGHGFGFTFSQGSMEWFGFEGEFGAGPGEFVYPHNDVLFWMLEFGLIGVSLYVGFWLALRSKYKRLITSPDRRVRQDALLLSGVFATMFVAGLTANGIFVQAIAERFFVAAAALFALARRYGTADHT